MSRLRRGRNCNLVTKAERKDGTLCWSGSQGMLWLHDGILVHWSQTFFFTPGSSSNPCCLSPCSLLGCPAEQTVWLLPRASCSTEQLPAGLALAMKQEAWTWTTSVDLPSLSTNPTAPNRQCCHPARLQRPPQPACAMRWKSVLAAAVDVLEPLTEEPR